MKAYKLCVSGGCPYAYIDGEHIIITDDFRGSARFTVEQLREILLKLDVK